jgi:hypothetical protein
MTTQTTAPATFPDHIDRHGVGHFVSRTPAEAFHPSEFITEEMEARGWDRDELARRMGGGFAVTRLALDLYLDVGPIKWQGRTGLLLRARRETTVTVSLPAADVPMLRAMAEHRGWVVEDDPDERPGAGWEARG